MPFVTIKDNLRFHYNLFPPSKIEPTQRLSHPQAKPLVLLLHPRFFDGDFFGPQCNDTRITDKYDLLALDHHWHGRSEVPLDDKPYDFERVCSEIFDVLDVLGVKHCYIFGLALGSLLAVKMAMSQPDKVLGLILCSLPNPVEDPEQLVQHQGVLAAALQRAEDGSDNFPAEVLNAARWVYYGQRRVETEEEAQKFIAASRFKPSNKQLLKKVYSVLLDRQAPSQSDWDKIQCGVVIIQGGSDVLYPPKVAQESYDLLRKAKKELHIIDGAPHMVSRTHTERVNEIFLNFVGTH